MINDKSNVQSDFYLVHLINLCSHHSVCMLSTVLMYMLNMKSVNLMPYQYLQYLFSFLVMCFIILCIIINLTYEVKLYYTCVYDMYCDLPILYIWI